MKSRLAALSLIVFGGAWLLSGPAMAQEAAAQEETARRVEAKSVTDWKAVFATVESLDVTPARSRIGGVVTRLAVDEGDRVEAGKLIAVITDEKIGLQQSGASAAVRGLEAARANAQIELDRAKKLFADGFIAKSRLDSAQTSYDLANNQLKAARAERSVVGAQEREGDVLAPSAGIVLRVPVVEGAVIQPGEPIAMVAAENYVLRISLPERHARHLKTGDPVRIASTDLTTDKNNAGEGRIVRIYPQIENGRVFADAHAENLGDYFVGQRIRVVVGAGRRQAITIPERYVATRYGVDFVSIRTEDGETIDIAVQRGRDAGAGGDIEILSGLSAGDMIVAQ